MGRESGTDGRPDREQEGIWMRFNPKARLDSGRVRQGGGGGLGGGGMGGGGIRMPIPTGRGGVGSIIVVILFIVLSQCMGIGPDILGGGGTSTGSAFDTSNVAAKDQSRYEHCQTGADAEEDMDCQRIGVENSLRDYWSDA